MFKVLQYFMLAALMLPWFIAEAQQKDDETAFRMLNERGEIYFSFKAPTEEIAYLSRIVSIDHFKEGDIHAYANKKTFPLFLELNIPYTLLVPPSMRHQPFMLDSDEIKHRAAWDFYPTYQGYVDIMDQFATAHPDLCELVELGTLSSGHKILCIHINDSLGIDQEEPEFFYTSSMHGDETSGYVTSLHLIDYLLTNYGTDTQVTNLVENIDIWINPLANPDGTYAGGDNTVFGATRGNANGVDLNRNFPDPEDGPHPDGNEYQEETEIFMEFAEDHDFVMSANFHDGTEVVNYP
jgi:murein tripeptide amidase MpaA